MYRLTIKGESPVICHSAAGIDERNPLQVAIQEITSKKKSSHTERDTERLRELETIISLWIGEDGLPTIPPEALRTSIEGGARKTREGPKVREGMIILSTQFEFDRDRYGSTIDDISHSAQFTVPVVVNRARILRTRAKFDCPWSVTAEVDLDEDVIDMTTLERVTDAAGRYRGIGDWRPERSGTYGRYSVNSIEQV